VIATEVAGLFGLFQVCSIRYLGIDMRDLCPTTRRSWRAAILAIAALMLAIPSGSSRAKGLDYRFVYVMQPFRSDEDLERIAAIMKRAAAAGYNGVVLHAGFDRLSIADEGYVKRVEALRELQRTCGIPIIPQVFSSGHGQILLEHDKNLAGAVPVRDQRFVVTNGRAVLEPDPVTHITNGDFETGDQDRAPGVRFQDRPGESTFIDTGTAKNGRQSLRVENFDGARRRFGRVMFEVAVEPFRCYRFSCWLKSEDIAAGRLLIQVYGSGDRVLMIDTPATSGEWRRVDVAFNSLGDEKVSIWVGVWSGSTGRFWIDDAAIEEVALLNLLRREGTPVVVRSEDGEAYEAGRDYTAPVDTQLNFFADHDGPPLEILPGGRIADGARLRVDYYQALALRHSQMGVCLSEPRLFEICDEIITALEEHLAPQAYFIGADEVRHGGWCRTCEARGISTGEIIGQGIARQAAIIRRHHPDAGIFLWSDMLDPHANARDHYFLTRGDLSGSWVAVPRDLVAVVWEPRAREASFHHFAELGFRVMASTYADRGGVDELYGWLGAMARIDTRAGVMYTTWRRDYSKLEAFAEAIRQAYER